MSLPQVRAVLQDGMQAPMEHIKLFDKYQPLISKEVSHKQEKMATMFPDKPTTVTTRTFVVKPQWE